MDALVVAMMTAASVVVVIAGCQGQGLIPCSRHGNRHQVALVAGRQQSIYPYIRVAVIKFGLDALRAGVGLQYRPLVVREGHGKQCLWVADELVNITLPCHFLHDAFLIVVA